MDNGDGIAGKGELLSVRFAKSVVPEQAGTHLPPHDWIAKGEMSNRGTCLSSTRLRGDDEGNYGSCPNAWCRFAGVAMAISG